MRALQHAGVIDRYFVTGTSYTVAAGVDGGFVDGVDIDTRGYENCAVILMLGAVAATTSVITARLHNNVSASTAASGTIGMVGTSLVNNADTDDNKLLVWEVYRPQRRYLRLSYQRTTVSGGTVAIDGLIVILWNGDKNPQSAGALIEASQTLNSPTPSAT